MGQVELMTLEMMYLDMENTAALELSGIVNVKTKLLSSGT